MIKYLSFDLQGTLSGAKFSDNFWINILPELYAKENNLSNNEAQNELKKYFKEIGKYDIRYYDDNYWSKKLKFNTIDILKQNDIIPTLNNKFLNFIKTMEIPVIIISTTTNIFIDYELGANIKYFYKTYSCVDDFNKGGKTIDIYIQIAKDLKVKTNEILHIGDNYEMDITNANKANVNAILFSNDEDSVIDKIKNRLEVK
jgi:putative hydrolase of the HAD superfamily